MGEQQHYHWVFLYWMPYDNNLWRHGSPIIQMLTSGAQSESVLVVVVSDLRREEQLSRRIITKGRIVDAQQLTVADSSSEDLYAENLRWGRTQFSAEKWVCAFLGHGGRLDEISPDEHPHSGPRSATQWMNIEKLSSIIARFNRRMDNRVELVFLQNCCKGTIEAHYTFRDAAKYTLSSQTRLRAPNRYYERLLQSLGHDPDINGGQLAQRIMDFEDPNMYNSYTATDNIAVCDLPSKINPLIDSILSRNAKAIPAREMQSYPYAGERLVDVTSFFKSIVNQVGADQQQYLEFVDFLTSSMIQRFRESPKSRWPSLSGLSLFLPFSKDELSRYSYMQVFSDLKLVELFHGVMFD